MFDKRKVYWFSIHFYFAVGVLKKTGFSVVIERRKNLLNQIYVISKIKSVNYRVFTSKSDVNFISCL